MTEPIIYFNKEDDKVYVKVPKGGQTRFELTDLPGKILQEETHSRELHDFDLAGYAPGVYFVYVFINEVLKSKKIIKE